MATSVPFRALVGRTFTVAGSTRSWPLKVEEALMRCRILSASGGILLNSNNLDQLSNNSMQKGLTNWKLGDAFGLCQLFRWSDSLWNAWRRPIFEKKFYVGLYGVRDCAVCYNSSHPSSRFIALYYLLVQSRLRKKCCKHSSDSDGMQPREVTSSASAELTRFLW